MLDNYSLKVVFNAHCDTSASLPRPLTTHQRVSLAVIITAVALVAIVTLIDIVFRKKLHDKAPDSKKAAILLKILSIWSVIGNTRRLFKKPQTSKAGAPQLLTVHGIKVLTLLWAMVTHTYLFGGFFNALWLYKKLIHVIRVPSLFWFQPVFNGWVIVDSFFFLSGVLLVYTMLPVLDKAKGKVSIALYILHRLVRLLPAMVGALSIQFLWPLLFRGPAMLDNQVHDYMVASCEQNWWTNLLFISNWIEPSKMVSQQDEHCSVTLQFTMLAFSGCQCLINMWYVSADTQLYISSFVLLLLLHKSPRGGLIATGGLLLFSIAFTAGVTLYNGLSPTILTDHMINIKYKDAR